MAGRLAFILAMIGVLMLVSLPARAQSPEELVRWIYTARDGSGSIGGLGYLTSPEQRSQFLSRRLISFYEANDSYGGDPTIACVDFAFEVPGNDYDANEIARTLSIAKVETADRISVTAQFTTFSQPTQVTYDFIPEDGFWRLDDIAGPGFRTSEIPCEPRSTATPAASGGGGAGYCYLSQDSTFRLEVGTTGEALFSLSSWQGGGHHCGASGQARPVDGGWIYAPGGTCQMQIEVTPDAGIRLSDPDWACKETLCGARAVIDGIEFPRTTQVDCASLPEQ